MTPPAPPIDFEELVRQVETAVENATALRRLRREIGGPGHPTGTGTGVLASPVATPGTVRRPLASRPGRRASHGDQETTPISACAFGRPNRKCVLFLTSLMAVDRLLTDEELDEYAQRALVTLIREREAVVLP